MKTKNNQKVKKTISKKEKLKKEFLSLAGILREEIKKGIVKPFNRKDFYNAK